MSPVVQAGWFENGAPPPSGALPCTGGASPFTLNLIGNGGADTLDVDAVNEDLLRREDHGGRR